MPSPRPSENASPTPPPDTSQMPATASTAAPMLKTVGRLCAMAHHKKGTMTQYVAVRKALMPGVVCCRPMVCVRNAEKSNTPSRTPMPSTRKTPGPSLKARAMRRCRIAARMRPAAVKRRPSSHAGGRTATTSFMTTKE